MNTLVSLRDLEPADVQIQFQCMDMEIDDAIDMRICVLKVTGRYPDGSAGAPVGEYLRGLSVFLREVYNLNGLVLDLSDLDYRWGNNLLRAVRPETLQVSLYFQDAWFGYRVVGSEKNKDALHTLFCEFGKSAEISKIYLSVDKAIENITSH